MSNWARKHTFELAAMVKSLSRDTSLPEEAQHELEAFYRRAKELVMWPHSDPHAQVNELIADLCRTCGKLKQLPCPGRSDWLQRCPLIGETGREA
ncbi:MAG: hypothetical protein EG825_10530 [Rhodocyclaceae bacterium]|nr:hypothetical protein [Rhodocyclaceae bacterium]